jgi:hypothetical protein
VVDGHEKKEKLDREKGRKEEVEEDGPEDCVSLRLN